MNLIQKTKIIGTILVSLLLLVTSQASMAQGNSQGKGSGKAYGKNKNIGVGNASDGIKGKVITNKGIVYTGNPLEISVQFARGSEIITSGDVDAYVLVFAPTVSEDSSDDSDTAEDSSTDSSSSDDSSTDASSSDDSSNDSSDLGDDASSEPLSDAIVLPVSDVASATSTKLFGIEAVDLSELASGTYQLGLVLTIPGGDPLVINDWYRGLLGLINVVGVTITGEAVDFDSDMDGEVDDDADGDGFSDDDDAEEESEDEGSDDSSDSSSDSTSTSAS